KVDDLLRNVLAVYRSKLTSKSIVVRDQFNAPHPFTASRGELLQVFSNIIANSIDAMEPGGSLHIETRQLADAGTEGTEVVVQDEGSGIESDHLTRIFEPFFTTKEQHGTGIGLWMAKQLVEKHKGRIQITSSTEPGRSGTRVCIYLPSSKQANASKAKGAEFPSRNRRHPSTGAEDAMVARSPE
ncbi:MAG TPA: HAMP domain-containing sensor histidine kinase, partial [Acidobacteriaceae bacterium]|nr:HAMP domain-containing sensor histidine kinase [Acidobacteriaceae bacterium]